MKKKMLYIMHIDWNWIKQRPQFLAEELSQYYDVTVVYTYGYKRSLIKQSNEFEGFKKIMPLYRLPSVKLRNTFFGKFINDLILKIQFLFIGKDFDYVWLTSPTYIETINKVFKDTKIIYDCMDDYPMFFNNELERSLALANEIKLLNIAILTLVSSENLKSIILNRSTLTNVIKINNGINNRFLENMKFSSKITTKDYLNLLYIGTISHWFDFKNMLNVLNDFSNITITLVGPCEVEIPHHSRLVYRGIIPHNELEKLVVDYDLLIMPFVVNELILSVDPVKIYEYISFGKNILSIGYPEMVKFKEFVHSYKNYDELKKQLKKLLVDNTLIYDENMAKEFLESNTWKKKAELIYNVLVKL